MSWFVMRLACSFLLAASAARAAVVEHTFKVGNLTQNKLCQEIVITAVNGELPGPTIFAREGDTLIVHVINNSPYDMTIHWRGIFQLFTAWGRKNYVTQCTIVPSGNYTYNFTITGQEGTLWWHAHASVLRATVYGDLIIRPTRRRSERYPFPKPHKQVPILLGHGIFQLFTAWADGTNYVTQCPIVPGGNYTYNFTITGQEGTLWWHAHASVLRATVYGALIIRPRRGSAGYPFPKPHKQVPILIGEWWNGNVVDMDNKAFLSGRHPDLSDAYTINGKPGDLYTNCPDKHTYKLQVVQGETYMLRIVNAVLLTPFFFKVAGHSFTVVAADASYTTPYITDVILIAPGQTVDALMVADAPPATYYMAARPYISINSSKAVYDVSTTTGVVEYREQPTTRRDGIIMPSLPACNDTPAAHRFSTSLTGLVRPGSPTVPVHVDEPMFVTEGYGYAPCGAGQPECRGQKLALSMNNVSFALPTKMSLLEAYFKGVQGIYTSDFPDNPPLMFDYMTYSEDPGSVSASWAFTAKGTKTKKVKYGSVVEMVLQNTALGAFENHPLHLHGYSFFVLAQGFGSYNASKDVESYNLVNPQVRNTIAVPTAGWAVIRFRANNPGVWLMHCHDDTHLEWGLAMAFEVENGPNASSTLPPPPPDFPTCATDQRPMRTPSATIRRFPHSWGQSA